MFDANKLVPLKERSYMKLEVLEDIASAPLNQRARGMEVDIVRRPGETLIVAICLRRGGRRTVGLRVGGLDFGLGLVIGVEACDKVMYLGQRGKRPF